VPLREGPWVWEYLGAPETWVWEYLGVPVTLGVGFGGRGRSWDMGICACSWHRGVCGCLLGRGYPSTPEGGYRVPLKPGCPCNHQPEPSDLNPATKPCNLRSETETGTVGPNPQLNPATWNRSQKEKFGQGGSRTHAKGSVAQREACGVSFPSVGPLGHQTDI